jgi:hypothetical protein
VGWYENPIPFRFLAPTDCLKIPAQFIYILTEINRKKISTLAILFKEGNNKIGELESNCLNLNIRKIKCACCTCYKALKQDKLRCPAIML